MAGGEESLGSNPEPGREEHPHKYLTRPHESAKALMARTGGWKGEPEVQPTDVDGYALAIERQLMLDHQSKMQPGEGQGKDKGAKGARVKKKGKGGKGGDATGGRAAGSSPAKGTEGQQGDQPGAESKPNNGRTGGGT